MRLLLLLLFTDWQIDSGAETPSIWCLLQTQTYHRWSQQPSEVSSKFCSGLQNLHILLFSLSLWISLSLSLFLNLSLSLSLSFSSISLSLSLSLSVSTRTRKRHQLCLPCWETSVSPPPSLDSPSLSTHSPSSTPRALGDFQLTTSPRGSGGTSSSTKPRPCRFYQFFYIRIITHPCFTDQLFVFSYLAYFRIISHTHTPTILDLQFKVNSGCFYFCRRTFSKKTTSPDAQRSFLEFILQPLYKVC